MTPFVVLAAAVFLAVIALPLATVGVLVKRFGAGPR